MIGKKKTFPTIIKMLEVLTRKSPLYCFPFFIPVTLFFASFQPKIAHAYSFRPFNTYYIKNTILSSSNITYSKSDIFLVKVQSTLCWWNTRPLSLNEFESCYTLPQGTACINCKTSTNTWKVKGKRKQIFFLATYLICFWFVLLF